MKLIFQHGFEAFDPFLSILRGGNMATDQKFPPAKWGIFPQEIMDLTSI
jgi:hypothetical protein